MKLRNRLFNFSRWDSYSFVIFLVVIIFQAIRWKVFPFFLDIYYHLLTANGFNKAGGWLPTCFWEYAPIGRPQIYPPLLHIIMLFLMKIGMPILFIGKLTQFAIYPLLLFTIWYVIRETFNKRLAFFVLSLIFSIYPFCLLTINYSAASLSLVFCLLSFLFIEKRIITSTILLTLAFYSHSLVSWLFVGVFILFGLFYRKNISLYFKTCALALFLASPLLFYQFNMRNYFILQKDLNLVENYYIELSIFHWLFCLFGLWECLKKKGKYYLFISLFLASIVLLFIGFIFRYFSFYGIMSIVFMNAVLLDVLYDKLWNKRGKIYVVSIFLLFFILSPTITIDLLKNDKNIITNSSYRGVVDFPKRKDSLNFLDSSLSNFVFYCNKAIRPYELTVYFPAPFYEIANIIASNASQDDIIYINYPYVGGAILSLLSHRVTSNAMLSEVRPYKNFDQIAASKLIIWQKDPNNMKEEPVNIIKKYNLNKIADTKLAFIYNNPEYHFKKQTFYAVISYKILFALLFSAFLLVVLSAKFSIDKY